jgi:hypothetical protein
VRPVATPSDVRNEAIVKAVQKVQAGGIHCLGEFRAVLRTICRNSATGRWASRRARNPNRRRRAVRRHACGQTERRREPRADVATPLGPRLGE